MIAHPNTDPILHQIFLCESGADNEGSDDVKKIVKIVLELSLFKVPEFDRLILDSVEAASDFCPIKVMRAV
jgi:hypothetical protein